MNRTDVSFQSGGDDCAAWLYRPDDADGLVPCVVMGHGFSMTKDQGLDGYARQLASAGVAVVVFDFRHLGDSGGQPRQSFATSAQKQDFVAAVAYARGVEGIDPEHIIVWGFSFSGGTAVDVAVDDARIAGAILVNPFLDGRHRVLGTVRRTPWVAIRVMAAALMDIAGRRRFIPVTGPPGTVAAMAWEGEAEGFAQSSGPQSTWRNEISPAVFATVGFHRPVRRAARLACPVWISLGERDITVSRWAIERFADRAPRAELHRYDVDHFEPFHTAAQDVMAKDQADWLRRSIRA
jgi:dienelactone hydrolase